MGPRISIASTSFDKNAIDNALKINIDLNKTPTDCRNALRSRLHELIRKGVFTSEDSWGDNFNELQAQATRAYYVLTRREYREKLLKTGSVEVSFSELNSFQRFAEEGRLDKMAQSLEEGADMNGFDEVGNTALYVAARAGRIDVVRLLLEFGADPDVVAKNSRSTALHAACHFGFVKIAQLLLEAGIDYSIRNVTGNQAAMEAWFPTLQERNDFDEYFDEHLRTPWGAACGSASENTPLDQLMKRIKDEDEDINEQHSLTNMTLLMMASKRGNLTLAKWLVTNGAKPNLLDKFNNTALHFAVKNNHIGIVNYLILNRAYPKLQNIQGHTPESLARSLNYTEIIKVFENDKSPERMWKAVREDDVEYFQGHEGFFNIQTLRDNNNWPILFVAANIGNLRLVQYLVEKKADINCIDTTSSTPLHTATRNGHVDVVKYLLYAQCNLHIHNAYGRVPREEIDNDTNDADKRATLRDLYDLFPTNHVELSGTYILHLYDTDSLKDWSSPNVPDPLPIKLPITPHTTFSDLCQMLKVPYEPSSPIPLTFKIAANVLNSGSKVPVLQEIIRARNSLSLFIGFPISLQFRKVRFDEKPPILSRNNTPTPPNFETKSSKKIRVTPTSRVIPLSTANHIELVFPAISLSFTLDEQIDKNNQHYAIFSITSVQDQIKAFYMPQVQIRDPVPGSQWSIYQYHNSAAAWLELPNMQLPSLHGRYAVVEKEELCDGMRLFRDQLQVWRLFEVNNHLYLKLKLPDGIDVSLFDVCYHGTSITAVESIVTDSLLKPGTVTATGKRIKIPEGHIKRNRKKNTEDFADAVFASPSMTYAGNPSYAVPFNWEYTLQSGRKHTSFFSLLKCLVRKGQYELHPSTIVDYVGYPGDDLKSIEWRVPHPERDLVVSEILFFPTNYFHTSSAFPVS